jgi:hypothetical protein
LTTSPEASDVGITFSGKSKWISTTGDSQVTRVERNGLDLDQYNIIIKFNIEKFFNSINSFGTIGASDTISC